jgi:predicted enzyme related to lactoylglutathione lyase
MELVQSRFVTEDVARLARFYATLVAADIVVNDYYVEVPTAAQRVGISRVRFSELAERPCGPPEGVRRGDVILDFAVDDIDAEYARVDSLGVQWVMAPTLQPWGRRAMTFRDPESHLINVYSRKENTDVIGTGS